MFAFLDIYGSFDVQPRDIADIIKTSVDVYENMKIQIINNSMAWANFKFLECHYANKSRKTGKKSLYCQASWFKRYQFLAYSVKEDGAFCLPCIFLPTQPLHGFWAKCLILKPYMHWKKIMMISPHETLQYQLTSMAHLLEFKKTFHNPSTRIDHSVNGDSIAKVKINCSILTAIVKSVEFCGRNGIAVCGHRDDGALNSSDILKKSVNLRSLINFWIDTGDKTENHLNSCTKTFNIYFKKAGQPLQGMELQEKEAHKYYNIYTENLLRKNLQLKDVC